MILAVIDGHGGGIGSYIIKRLREEDGLNALEIIALGTNSLATSAMMKARANRGASGENAITYVVRQVDMITGSFNIVMANSMLGELTPKMAEAIASSTALKILLPLPIEKISLIGYNYEPLPHLTDKLIQKIKEIVIEHAQVTTQAKAGDLGKKEKVESRV
ncbi:MAG: DUF3842 family protein [bacterium]